MGCSGRDLGTRQKGVCVCVGQCAHGACCVGKEGLAQLLRYGVGSGAFMIAWVDGWMDARGMFFGSVVWARQGNQSSGGKQASKQAKTLGFVVQSFRLGRAPDLMMGQSESNP